MKNCPTIAIMMLGLAAILSCGGKPRQSMLDKAEASMDKQALLEAVEYYKAKGTANEQMKAHYLLACAYRNLNWQNEAVTSFYNAIESADTLDSDCDFSLLVHVYGQLADLLSGKATPSFFRSVYPKMERYAAQTKDTLAMMEAQSVRAQYYQEIWELDSAVTTLKDCMATAQKLQAPQAIAPTAKQLGLVYVEQEKYNEALKCFEVFEKHQLDPNGRLISPAQHWNYWIGKAKCLYWQRNYDAALPLLHAANGFDNPDGKREAARLLCSIYDKKQVRDSAQYYQLKMFSEAATSNVSPFSEDRLMELQSYSRVEKEREMRLQSEQRIKTLRNGALLVGLLAIVLGLLFRIWRMHQKKSADSSIPMKIARVQASPICNHFYDLYRSEKKPSAEDWAALERAVGEEFPDVISLLRQHILNEKEHRICLLLCVDFKPKQIHFFLQTAPGTTTSIRHRLAAKLFNVDCGAKEFDRMLLAFSFNSQK